MSFLETPRFPERISFGATGGPQFSTTIIRMFSGVEQRNVNWEQARGRWDVSQAVQNNADFEEVVKFFRAVKGQAIGFRFKDFSDYQTSSGTLIATGVTDEWQMHKPYTAGALSENRKISKPVNGTIIVSGGGSYTIDYTKGTVTRTGGANPTGWTGEFDIPARFDTDEMKAEVVGSLDGAPLMRWSSIPIVEIKL